jgi:hypothetical protein
MIGNACGVHPYQRTLLRHGRALASWNVRIIATIALVTKSAKASPAKVQSACLMAWRLANGSYYRAKSRTLLAPALHERLGN